MKQILVTVDTNQPLQNIRKAINMLRGVVSTTVVKEPILTKTQKQQAFVKESLTRALQEVKLAKLEGRKLPDARDLLKVFTTPSVPLVGDRNPQGREDVTALQCYICPTCPSPAGGSLPYTQALNPYHRD